jgi:hypothetical protein
VPRIADSGDEPARRVAATSGRAAVRAEAPVDVDEQVSPSPRARTRPRRAGSSDLAVVVW